MRKIVFTLIALITAALAGVAQSQEVIQRIELDPREWNGGHNSVPRCRDEYVPVATLHDVILRQNCRGQWYVHRQWSRPLYDRRTVCPPVRRSYVVTE